MSKEQLRKVTLEQLIAKKEQAKLAKQKPKTATLFVKTLGGTITVQQPMVAVVQDSVKMEEDGDAYLVYQCCVDPCLKDQSLRENEDGTTETFAEVVNSIFLPGEVNQIAEVCLRLAGYDPTAVNLVEAVKN